MQIFISGTDTNVGKTVIASWLALHTGFAYFKPIQTGVKPGTTDGADSTEVKKLAKVKIYPESFIYPEPLSPHLAAQIANQEINSNKIILPVEKNLIVEGAGGLLVPINKKFLMIDLIKKWNIPVILVAHTKLGTINHTLLSLEALKSRSIKILGVIMNGEKSTENKKAIEQYGKIKILAEFPCLNKITYNELKKISLPRELKCYLIATKK